MKLNPSESPYSLSECLDKECDYGIFKNDTEGLLKLKIAKIKQLLLLTDPAVGHWEMNQLTAEQWMEFIRVFPDENPTLKLRE